MTFSSTAEHPLPSRWPLMASAGFTGLVVTFLCAPPRGPLHSWGQVAAIATAYLVAAAIVHTFAVWISCRMLCSGETRWRGFLPALWAAWVVIVWFPLIALLTKEESPWVAFFLPLTAALAVLVMSLHRPVAGEDETGVNENTQAGLASDAGTHELFHQEKERPLWRRLLPAILLAATLEAGLALLLAEHAWWAGLLFAVAVTYVAVRTFSGILNQRRALSASAGNSLAVWLLMAVALSPFLIGISAEMTGLLGMSGVKAAAGKGGYAGSSGFSGIILHLPPKPHELVTPDRGASASVPRAARAIPFEGSYWYFKAPLLRPGPNAPHVRGNPLKAKIFSTDGDPLIMEARQRLDLPVAMKSLSSMQLNLVNADTTPGSITVELRVHGVKSDSFTTSYVGQKVLASSTVSPIPGQRAPVHESLTFTIPQGYRDWSFDEIIVAIRPSRARALSAPHVSVESFTLQP